VTIGREGPGPERPGPDYPPEWDTEPSGCNCEPITYDDGSSSHEEDCRMYPWCPHEMGRASCPMPCSCPCAPCTALGGAS
jgi:hypothetical protein